MKYFENFPITAYTFDPNYNDWFYVVNIFNRVGMLNSVISNISVYYRYDLQDSDNFENIAYKYYGNIDQFWIILFANQVIDGLYGRPLNGSSFNNYVDAKYIPANGNPGSGLIAAQELLDHYELQTTTITVSVNGNYDSNTVVTYYPNTTYAIYDVNNPARNPTNLPTLNPYNPILPFVSPAPVVVANGTPQQITVSQNIRLVAVSAYDTEDTNNESKRSIDIIKKDYTTQIEKELSILLSK